MLPHGMAAAAEAHCVPPDMNSIFSRLCWIFSQHAFPAGHPSAWNAKHTRSWFPLTTVWLATTGLYGDDLQL